MTIRREFAPREFPRRTASGTRIRWVRTSVVRGVCDPFRGCWPELVHPLRLREVARVLDGQTACLHPVSTGPTGRTRHAQKVAWFVQHGFSEPIEVDVGIPSLGCRVSWPVVDGNHRLAAGIYRQDVMGEDPWLPLSVGGSISHARSLGLW